MHELKGERAGTWTMKINKNWRLTFRFESGDAVDLYDTQKENESVYAQIERIAA